MITLAGEIGPTGKVLAKGRHGFPGEVRPHLEVRAGSTWSRRLRRWMRRSQVIDREND